MVFLGKSHVGGDQFQKSDRGMDTMFPQNVFIPVTQAASAG